MPTDPLLVTLVAGLAPSAAEASRGNPLVVALDGRSGAGKSTLAARLADHDWAHRGDVLIIEGDQFYLGGSSATWDARSPIERADNVIDWRRQHRVLTDLRRRGAASWMGFDWASEDWDSDAGALHTRPHRADAASIIVLEGAYSARPELHDVVDMRVLLDTPTPVRRRRLLEREGEEYRADWEARWTAAEEYYFGSVMPRERFDLVLIST